MTLLSRLLAALDARLSLPAYTEPPRDPLDGYRWRAEMRGLPSTVYPTTEGRGAPAPSLASTTIVRPGWAAYDKAGTDAEAAEIMARVN